MPRKICSICTEQVSKKNGIKCQGACKEWLHYTCLQSSPEKVQEIKDGAVIVIVRCPCLACLHDNQPNEVSNCPKSEEFETGVTKPCKTLDFKGESVTTGVVYAAPILRDSTILVDQMAQCVECSSKYSFVILPKKSSIIQTYNCTGKCFDKLPRPQNDDDDAKSENCTETSVDDESDDKPAKTCLEEEEQEEECGDILRAASCVGVNQTESEESANCEEKENQKVNCKCEDTKETNKAGNTPTNFQKCGGCCCQIPKPGSPTEAKASQTELKYEDTESKCPKGCQTNCGGNIKNKYKYYEAAVKTNHPLLGCLVKENKIDRELLAKIEKLEDELFVKKAQLDCEMSIKQKKLARENSAKKAKLNCKSLKAKLDCVKSKKGKDCKTKMPLLRCVAKENKIHREYLAKTELLEDELMVKKKTLDCENFVKKEKLKCKSAAKKAKLGCDILKAKADIANLKAQMPRCQCATNKPDNAAFARNENSDCTASATKKTYVCAASAKKRNPWCAKALDKTTSWDCTAFPMSIQNKKPCLENEWICPDCFSNDYQVCEDLQPDGSGSETKGNPSITNSNCEHYPINFHQSSPGICLSYSAANNILCSKSESDVDTQRSKNNVASKEKSTTKIKWTRPKRCNKSTEYIPKPATSPTSPEIQLLCEAVYDMTTKLKELIVNMKH